MATRKSKFNTEQERLEAKRASNRKAQKKFYQKHSPMGVKMKWLAEKGFESQREYSKTTPSYQSRLVNSEPNKFKTEYQDKPDDCKAIPNWPTYYAQPNGEIWRWSEKRRCYLNIKQQTQKSGYQVVQIYDETNKRHVKFVHILMCETFIGPRPHPNHQVDHIDYNRANNNINNLRWLTQTDNLKRRPKWAKK
jgi:hypothetical protein